ncbi:MAG: LysR family transcriptional regulator [Rhodococcus sp. (in: high G+C Gram-positive bacteria)]|nr:MAG: LysR family transcriptional regulator [Rhodococcus sp. (in: high G+C Gram-positive bacteria)]
MNTVDMNLLRALDVVLDERNLTRAAKRLSIGQPAMTATMQRLRTAFDDALLVRAGRHYTLTPFAHAIQPEVRKIIEQTDILLAKRGKFDPAVDHRLFKIKASDYASLILLRPLVAELPALAPGVDLDISHYADDIGGDLRRGEVDLAIIPESALGAAPELTRTALFSDQFVCVVARDNDRVGTELTVADLMSLPYLACTHGNLVSAADAQLDRLGITRAVTMTSQSFVAAPLLLSGTRMITVIHERLARYFGEFAQLRILTPPVELAGITEMMCWNRLSNADPAHTWLRGQLTRIAASLR